MKCGACGSTDIQANGVCRVCGGRGEDEYSPPTSVDSDPSYGVGGMEPWEYKKWRISGISWAAIMLACFAPPVGLVVGLLAIAKANRHKNRPGNKAMAIASVATSFYMAFMIFYIGWIIWEESSRMSRWDDPYYYSPPPDYLSDPLASPEASDDPWSNPEDMKELERLLEEMQKAQQGAPAD